MYLNHYNLKDKPFEMSPGPRFLWLGEKHLEALAALQYGISENKGFLLLTGDVGLGKTALIHRLINEVDDSKVIGYIPNPAMDSLDFFNTLSLELGMDQKFASKGAFLIELKKFLIKSHADKKIVLLIIDEAQRLYHELLEEIRLLSNIELETQKLINIFFVGQPEFNHILLEHRNRALRQRIAVRYQVEPLNLQETSHYILHRLKVAGANHQIFKLSAIHEIFRFSKGCPRLINIVCDHALLTGYAAGLKTIDSTVIKECEPELRLPEEYTVADLDPAQDIGPSEPEYLIIDDRKSAFWNNPLIIGSFILFCGIVSYLFFWPTDRSSMEPMAQQDLAAPSTEKDQAALQNEPKMNRTSDRLAPQAPGQSEPDSAKTDNLQATLSSTGQTETIPQDVSKPSAPPDKVPLQVPEKRTSDTPAIDDSQSRLHTAVSEPPSGLPERSVPVTAGQSASPTGKIVEESENSTEPQMIVDDGEATNQSLIQTAAAEPQGGKDNRNTSGGILTETDPSLSKEPGKDYIEDADIQSQERPIDDKSLAVEGDKTLPDTAKPSIAGNQSQSNMPVLPPKSDALEKVESKPGAIPLIQNQDASTATPEQKGASETKQNKPQEIIEKTATAKLDSFANNKQPTADLENRIRSFLQHYCNTYASKELGNFAGFFSADATENDKPFASLLPKYGKNFSSIDKIQYRIDLQNYTYNEKEKSVEVEGRFILKWMPYGQDWRENSGKISLRLKEKGSSFMVQRLDYSGDRRKSSVGSGSASSP